VRDYHLYLLNEGRIIARRDIQGADDREACEVALQTEEHHALELWEGARMVWSFTPQKILVDENSRTG
jgi:hypothetical protein